MFQFAIYSLKHKDSLAALQHNMLPPSTKRSTNSSSYCTANCLELWRDFMSNRACVKQRQDFCRSSVFISISFCMYFYTTCDWYWISREQNSFFVCVHIYPLSRLKRWRPRPKVRIQEDFWLCWWLLAGQVLCGTSDFILSSHQHCPEMALQAQIHPSCKAL